VSLQGSKPWNFDAAAPHMDHPSVKEFVAHWKKVYHSEPHPSVDGFLARSSAPRAEATLPTSAVFQQKLLPKGVMA
jgi:hypothetical protein